MSTMSITQSENLIWLAPSSCRCRNWMVCGCILRVCLWVLGGTVIVAPRVTRALGLPTRISRNSAIWGTQRSVRVCPANAIATQSASRSPETTVRGSAYGLCARLGTALQPTARWNMMSTGKCGFRRTPTRASRKCWSVTFSLTYSEDFLPPPPTPYRAQAHDPQRRKSHAPAGPGLAIRDG
jgi:hypothetical protein